MIPAIRAVSTTLPLGAFPCRAAASASGPTDTNASAAASRAVIGFAPTSTIRARPLRSR